MSKLLETLSRYMLHVSTHRIVSLQASIVGLLCANVSSINYYWAIKVLNEVGMGYLVPQFAGTIPRLTVCVCL